MASASNSKVKISNKTIDALKPQEKLYRVYDSDLHGFTARVQPTGTVTYYFEYRNELGQNKSFKIGRHGNITATQAREIAKEKSAECTKGVDVQAERLKARRDGKEAQANTLEGFIDGKYNDWAVAHLNTGKHAVRRIKRNFAHLLSRPLHEITQWDIDQWTATQKEAGKAITTINREVAFLKAALSKAKEWKVIAFHPLEELKPIKTDSNGVIRYLAPDEEARLMEALATRERQAKEKRASANDWRSQRGYDLYPVLAEDFVDHLKPMVILTLFTGLRRGEIFNLRWEHVDFHLQVLTVVGKTAKSKTTRHIPLNMKAVEVMKQWKKQTSGTGYVFCGKDGKRLDNISTSWENLLRLANISNFRWHDLRHHFASKLVMQGVDLNTVRELLGHADIRMTLRYAHLAPAHKAAAVGKLSFPE